MKTTQVRLLLVLCCLVSVCFTQEICGENEVWSDCREKQGCATCEDHRKGLTVHCAQGCTEGCVCIAGFIRESHSGPCVADCTISLGPGDETQSDPSIDGGPKRPRSLLTGTPTGTRLGDSAECPTYSCSSGPPQSCTDVCGKENGLCASKPSAKCCMYNCGTCKKVFYEPKAHGEEVDCAIRAYGRGLTTAGLSCPVVDCEDRVDESECPSECDTMCAAHHDAKCCNDPCGGKCTTFYLTANSRVDVDGCARMMNNDVTCPSLTCEEGGRTHTCEPCTTVCAKHENAACCVDPCDNCQKFYLDDIAGKIPVESCTRYLSDGKQDGTETSTATDDAEVTALFNGESCDLGEAQACWTTWEDRSKCTFLRDSGSLLQKPASLEISCNCYSKFQECYENACGTDSTYESICDNYLKRQIKGGANLGGSVYGTPTGGTVYSSATPKPTLDRCQTLKCTASMTPWVKVMVHGMIGDNDKGAAEWINQVSTGLLQLFNGGDTSVTVKNIGMCPKENQVWEECGSACPPTCDDSPTACTEQCVEGCFCKQDYVIHNAKCIMKKHCPTTDGGDPQIEGDEASQIQEGYSYTSVAGDNKLSWGYGPDKYIEFQLTTTLTAASEERHSWIAIAFSNKDDPQMKLWDIIAFWVDEDKNCVVSDMSSKKSGPPIVDASQDVTCTEVVTEDTNTVFRFKRKINTGDTATIEGTSIPVDRVLSDEDTTAIRWAKGTSAQLGSLLTTTDMHSYGFTGFFPLNKEPVVSMDDVTTFVVDGLRLTAATYSKVVSQIEPIVTSPIQGTFFTTEMDIEMKEEYHTYSEYVYHISNTAFDGASAARSYCEVQHVLASELTQDEIDWLQSWLQIPVWLDSNQQNGCIQLVYSAETKTSSIMNKPCTMTATHALCRKFTTKSYDHQAKEAFASLEWTVNGATVEFQLRNQIDGNDGNQQQAWFAVGFGKATDGKMVNWDIIVLWYSDDDGTCVVRDMYSQQAGVPQKDTQQDVQCTMATSSSDGEVVFRFQRAINSGDIQKITDDDEASPLVDFDLSLLGSEAMHIKWARGFSSQIGVLTVDAKHIYPGTNTGTLILQQQPTEPDSTSKEVVDIETVVGIVGNREIPPLQDKLDGLKNGIASFYEVDVKQVEITDTSFVADAATSEIRRSTKHHTSQAPDGKWVVSTLTTNVPASRADSKIAELQEMVQQNTVPAPLQSIVTSIETVEKVTPAPSGTPGENNSNGCRENEEFSGTGSACVGTCVKPEGGTGGNCGETTVSGCFCKQGYVRLNDDASGQCLPIADCPASTTTDTTTTTDGEKEVDIEIPPTAPSGVENGAVSVQCNYGIYISAFCVVACFLLLDMERM